MVRWVSRNEGEMVRSPNLSFRDLIAAQTGSDFRSSVGIVAAHTAHIEDALHPTNWTAP